MAQPQSPNPRAAEPRMSDGATEARGSEPTTGPLARRRTGVSWHDGSLTISPKGLTLFAGIVAALWQVGPVILSLADGPKKLAEVAETLKVMAPAVQQVQQQTVLLRHDIDASQAAVTRIDQRVGALETQAAGFAVLKDQRDRQLGQLEGRVSTVEAEHRREHR